MLIRIDISTGVPLWQQIVAQVTRQVMSGSLAVEERLPTVRELASELRINPNTVARAYQELERNRIVETRRGQGTFACDGASHQIPNDWRKNLIERIDALLVEAKQMQVQPGDLLDLIDQRLREMQAKLPTDKILQEVDK